MKNIEIEQFIQQLLKRFPAFIKKMKPDDLQPYMLFGDFGIYIRDLIDHGNYDETEINTIFEFLNEMGNSSNEEVHNVLTVGILEIVIDCNKAALVAEQKLEGGALHDLRLIRDFWHKE